MEYASIILKAATFEIAKGLSEQEQKFWDTLDRIWKIVRKKVQQLADRFKGIMSHLGRYLLESLDELKDSLRKSGDAIVNAFASFSERFLDLMQNLMEQMFKFLTQFGIIAEKKGFQISKIDIRLPSIKFEPVTLFLVSIPFPKIEAPDIRLSIDVGKRKQ